MERLPCGILHTIDFANDSLRTETWHLKVSREELKRFQQFFEVQADGHIYPKDIKITSNIHEAMENQPHGVLIPRQKHIRLGDNDSQTMARKETDKMKMMTLDEMIQRREEALTEFNALPIYTPPEMVEGRPVRKCKKCGAVYYQHTAFDDEFTSSKGDAIKADIIHLACDHCGYKSIERLLTTAKNESIK